MQRLLLTLAVLGASVATVRSAAAQSTIRNPGDHPRYPIEIEPHGDLTLFGAPSGSSDGGFGAGLRLTIPIVDRGFVRSIDDSVGIGFGADIVSYPRASNGDRACDRFAPAPSGTSVCVDAGGSSSRDVRVFFPVLLQWNFWLTPRWSVFAEPGFALDWTLDRNGIGQRLDATPALFLGGRYRFARSAALTLRLGYPTASIGVSFLP